MKGLGKERKGAYGFWKRVRVWGGEGKKTTIFWRQRLEKGRFVPICQEGRPHSGDSIVKKVEDSGFGGGRLEGTEKKGDKLNRKIKKTRRLDPQEKKKLIRFPDRRKKKGEKP